MRFLESLKEYDKDNIPPQVINKIRRDYISNKDFVPALIKKVSSACEGLCKWVIAISDYDGVFKIIAPKQASLKEAQNTLEQQMAKLDEKKKELKIITDKLQTLYDKLSTKQIEQKVKIIKYLKVKY
jgi:dynein heavy chain